MKRKTLLALAIASAFAVSTSAVYAEGDKDASFPDGSNLIPMILVEGEATDERNVDLIAEGEDKGESKADLIA